MKKPNFFIIGAPKCATTSLASWLSEHPTIFMSAVKEPNYFNEDYTIRDTLKYYESLFKGVTDQHIAIGEASVWYLYSHTAIANIENYTKDARYIVCVRNPADMAYSLHQQYVFGGKEHINSFEEAWGLNADRLKGNNISKWNDAPARHLSYYHACALGTQLETLYGQIQKERILLVVLDDIIADTPREYVKILNFLGVDDDHRKEFPVVNSSKVLRYNMLRKLALTSIKIKTKLGVRHHGLGILTQIEKLNKKERQKPQLSQDFRKQILKAFSEEINKLEVILNRDLTAWRQ